MSHHRERKSPDFNDGECEITTYEALKAQTISKRPFEGAKRKLGFDSSSSTIVADLGTKPWVVCIVDKALNVALESLFAFGDKCLPVPGRGMANTRIEG
jgi:hypothetical protein